MFKFQLKQYTENYEQWSNENSYSARFVVLFHGNDRKS